MPFDTEDMAIVSPHRFKKPIAVEKTMVKGRQLSLGARKEIAIEVDDFFQWFSPTMVGRIEGNWSKGCVLPQ